MLLAAALAGGELVEQAVAILLDLHVGGIAGVERMESGALPDDVRGHAGADHGDPVLLADAGPPESGGAGRVRVLPDLERVEAVAEGAVRLVDDEAVLALPAGAVGGVERVQVEVAPVVVERHPDGRRPEAEDARPRIGHA